MRLTIARAKNGLSFARSHSIRSARTSWSRSVRLFSSARAITEPATGPGCQSGTFSLVKRNSGPAGARGRGGLLGVGGGGRPPGRQGLVGVGVGQRALDRRADPHLAERPGLVVALDVGPAVGLGDQF